MSISSSVRKAGPFAGNGAQTVFPFAFKVFDQTDVLVQTTVTATGVTTTRTLGADYAVALNADQDAAPGGNITMTTAPAAGVTLAATSLVAALQPVTVTNGGGFFPAVFNAVFDRLTILVQQLAERMTRTFTVPLTSSVTSLTLPVVASGVLQWNADATALQAITLPDLSLSLALPSMAGKSGQFLTNNGVAASWGAAPVLAVAGLTGTITGAGLKTALAISLADVSGYAADQAAVAAAYTAADATTLASAKAFAIAMAAAL